MRPPRARPDALALHPFTLRFRDDAEEHAYQQDLFVRFSRRRYASTSLLSAAIWAVTGAWFLVEAPAHRAVVVATVFAFAVPVALLLTASVYVLPRYSAQKWIPRTGLLAATALGLIPAVNAYAGHPVLIGLCIYLLTLHSFLGLRFVEALTVSGILIAAYLGSLGASGAPRMAIAETVMWATAALIGAMFVSYTQETQKRNVFHQAGLLASERAKSDRLIANMLPAGIPERLKNEPLPLADAVPEATVLFADLVGFTVLSSQIAPRALVTLLNEIFTAIDALVAKHGLEKIKTIGDAYMVVAGAPIARADHAEAMARFALELRSAIRPFAGGSLSMRIGIHSGPVVAGVIGTSKYSYDLWGDTVNTASRMESHGAPDRIHVSGAAAALLGAGWQLEERGEIEVKGKGLLRTSWLVGHAGPTTGVVPTP